MLDISSMKTSGPLADFSLRAGNDLMADFVADEVFTPAYVSKAQGKYYQYDLSNYREVETQKSSKAEADTVDYGAFATSYQCQLHKLRGEIDPQDVRDADAPVSDIDQDTALTVMERILIRRERIMAGIVSTSGNYASGLSSTLGAGLKWSDTGGDPEGDAVTVKKAVKGICGRMPNALGLSWQAWLSLCQSAALKDRLKYTSGQSITLEQVKNLLGLDYVHICKAQYNANLEGNATQSLSDIWGTYALFYVKQPAQKLRTVTAFRNLYVNKLTTKTFVDEKRGGPEGPIRMVETQLEYVMKTGIVDSQASGKIGGAYLLLGVI